MFLYIVFPLFSFAFLLISSLFLSFSFHSYLVDDVGTFFIFHLFFFCNVLRQRYCTTSGERYSNPDGWLEIEYSRPELCQTTLLIYLNFCQFEFLIMYQRSKTAKEKICLVWNWKNFTLFLLPFRQKLISVWSSHRQGQQTLPPTAA